MIIGFTGRKGSGKDTAADFVQNHPDYYTWARIKFADGLKDMIRAFLSYNGLEPEEIERYVEGDLKETPTEYFGGKTPRFVMQTIGTEWGRNTITDSIWVDATKRRCSLFNNCLITDVRFPNEVEAVRELGGKIIKIDRPNLREEDHHASEVHFNYLKQDYNIINDGSPLDLRDKVLGAMKDILSGH